jgi:hypothetical protein
LELLLRCFIWYLRLTNLYGILRMYFCSSSPMKFQLGSCGSSGSFVSAVGSDSLEPNSFQNQCKKEARRLPRTIVLLSLNRGIVPHSMELFQANPFGVCYLPWSALVPPCTSSSFLRGAWVYPVPCINRMRTSTVTNL